MSFRIVHLPSEQTVMLLVCRAHDSFAKAENFDAVAASRKMPRREMPIAQEVEADF